PVPNPAGAVDHVLDRSERGFVFQYPVGFTGTVSFTYDVVAVFRLLSEREPLPVSNLAVVTITVFDRDSDGDGVSDAEEDSSFTGVREPVAEGPDLDASVADLRNTVDGRAVDLRTVT